MTAPHTTTGVYWAPIPEDLLYDPAMSDKAVRVYGALVRHGLDPSSCFPSHARIGELIGCAARSVQRPIRDLESAGWIVRVARYDESGQRTTDGFHVRQRLSDPAPVAHMRAGTAQESAEGPRDAARGVRAEVRVEREQENESQGTRELSLALDDAPPRVEPSFAEFYAAYPRRVGRRAAETAFAAALRRAPAAEIVAGAERYAADPNLPDDRQYVPHPATWLRRDGWADEPLPERSGGRQTARRAPVDTDRAGPEGRIEL